MNNQSHTAIFILFMMMSVAIDGLLLSQALQCVVGSFIVHVLQRCPEKTDMRSMRSMRGGFISRSRGPLQNFEV
jgi:hypothetical protein